MPGAAARLLVSTDLSDPITSLEVSPVSGAVAVGSASGAVKVIADSACVVLCRRAEEAIGAIHLSPGEVIVTVGDVGIKRWSLGSLRPEAPAFAGAVAENIAFPFSHSYGQCASSTCLLAGPRLIVSRGEGEIFHARLDKAETDAHFEIVPLGPAGASVCWPVAFDGDRIVLFSNRRKLHVYVNYELQCEFDLGRRSSLGLVQLLEDRLVGVLNGRVCVWTLGRSHSEKQIGPHLHGWRRRVLHFCLGGNEASHVALVTLGSDCTVCFFEGPLDLLVFKKRVAVDFARFHLELPYFMRVIDDATLVFNDDRGLYLLNHAS